MISRNTTFSSAIHRPTNGWIRLFGSAGWDVQSINALRKPKPSNAWIIMRFENSRVASPYVNVHACSFFWKSGWEKKHPLLRYRSLGSCSNSFCQWGDKSLICLLDDNLDTESEPSSLFVTYTKMYPKTFQRAISFVVGLILFASRHYLSFEISPVVSGNFDINRTDAF